MPAKRRNRETCTREYRFEAVRLANEGTRSVVEVAADLGIGAEHLYRWRREFADAGLTAFPGNGKMSSVDEELHRLRREVKNLTEERDFLKKGKVLRAGTRVKKNAYKGLQSGLSKKSIRIRKFS